MRVFLAGSGQKPWENINFFNFYRLSSYEYLKKDSKEIKLLKNFKDFILDSGIFSFLNGKDTKNVDWEKYMNDYADFVRENKIKNYVEMDIESLIGLEETEKLRARLEKRVGWKCIPVWHMNRGYDKWLEICKDYDYVCFGAFLTDGLKESKFHMIEQFLKDAKKYNCKVHGLGFTNFKWLPKLHFYSVDSSSWTVGNRFGSIEKFEDNKIKHIKRPVGTSIKEHDKLAWHNFKEWVKYQKWADKNIIEWFENIPLSKKLGGNLNESIIKFFNNLCSYRYVEQYI